MDVRCERCKTEYEFDDARITEAGVTVKCTTCEHVFKVMKAPVAAASVDPNELPKSAAPPREWRVRQASGNVFTFKELTTLQKWIVERKVSRDDEISLTGESWKRLGNIAELASFFQVVDEAQKGTQLAALQNQAMLGLWTPPELTPPAAPVAAPAPAQPAAPLPPPVPAHPQSPAAGPGPSASTAPDFASAPPRRPRLDLDDQELEAAAFNKSRGGRGVATAVLLLAILGGGGYAGYTYYWLPEQARQAAETDRIARELVEKQKADEEAARARADAELKAKAEAEAAAKKAAQEKAAGEAAAEAPVDAGAPASAAAARHDFNFYMSQGDRLRERERVEAALDAYGHAADLKPDRAEPVAGRGLALLDMGQPLQAEASFEQALKLNRRYGVALMGLAEALKAQGKKQGAIKAYEAYLEELPDGAEANVAKVAIERLRE